MNDLMDRNMHTLTSNNFDNVLNNHQYNKRDGKWSVLHIQKASAWKSLMLSFGVSMNHKRNLKL